MRYDPSPDALEEQEGAREGQAPTSLCRVPIPYWFWCCPSSAHRGQRAQGRAGHAWKSPLVPAPSCPPAPVTSFLLREPSPLRQREARDPDGDGQGGHSS